MYSFIIPLYKDQKVFRAIESFLECRGYRGAECLIVMNGTPDDLKKKVLERYKKIQNIRIYYSDNPSIAYSRNLGILKAKHDYMIFLDSDCYLRKDFIEIADQFIEGADVLKGRMIFRHTDNPYDENYSKLRDHWYNKRPRAFYTPDLIVNKKVFEKVGYYDPELSGGEDAEWSREANKKWDLKTAYIKDLIMYHAPDPPPSLVKVSYKYGYKLGRSLRLKPGILPDLRIIASSVYFDLSALDLFESVSFNLLVFKFSVANIIGITLGYLSAAEFKTRIHLHSMNYPHSKRIVEDTLRQYIKLQ
jgi:glycosyltransferase involved in cell wall biosynthesis